MEEKVSLLHHWRNFFKSYPCPDSYVDWTLYSIIGSALQRRVWTGDVGDEIYPNTFIILVGPPATGKSWMIRYAKKCIGFHPHSTQRLSNEYSSKLSEASKTLLDAQNEEAQASIKRMINPPLMLPMAADSTTFESLVQEIGLAARTHSYKIIKEDGSIKNTAYFHSSITLINSELSSLFKKKVEDVVKFLQDTYDCQDFRHRTKTQGEDCIQNCCVNVFAGATPEFIRNSFSSSLLSEGMASRIMFLFESGPRCHIYDIPDKDEEQLKGMELVLARIKTLNSFYGRVNLSPDCKAFAKNFFEKIHPTSRGNDNPKLKDYYARKRLHMDKIAMILHFMDNDSMTMELETMQRALLVLADVESRMHLALVYENQNPLYNVSQRIVEFLRDTGEKTEVELLANFMHDLPRWKTDLVEILNNLKSIGQIGSKLDMTGKNPAKYFYKVPTPFEAIIRKIDEVKEARSSGEKINDMLNKIPKGVL